MTLRSRLGAGLVTIAIILVTPLVFAIQSLRRLHDDATALRDREFAASLLIGRLREGLNDVRRQELALIFARDVPARDAMETGVATVAALADSLSHFELRRSPRHRRSSADRRGCAVEYVLSCGRHRVTDFVAKVFTPRSAADSVAPPNTIAANHDRVNQQTSRIAPSGPRGAWSGAPIAGRWPSGCRGRSAADSTSEPAWRPWRTETRLRLTESRSDEFGTPPRVTRDGPPTWRARCSRRSSCPSRPRAQDADQRHRLLQPSTKAYGLPRRSRWTSTKRSPSRRTRCPPGEQLLT